MIWKPQAPRMVASPSTSTAAGATHSRRRMSFMAGSSGKSGHPDGDIEQNDGGRHAAGDQAEALFDEILDRGPVAAEQPGEREEARAPRDYRRGDEQAKV